jgi:AbrB family looped-hinge helix DNA binding protein
MRITSKGQVTIPVEVRERLGLLPQTEVEIVVEGGQAVLRKLRRSRRRGGHVVAHLRGRSTASLSTDEILALTRGE